MIDYFNLSPSKMDEILEKRQAVLSNLFYYDYNVIELLEEPEGASRPRVRILKNNYNRVAMQQGNLVHVYVPGAGEDHRYMRRLVDSELFQLDGLISTPCEIEYNAYLKTPSNTSVVDKFLCEMGLFRPPFSKPDWDNIGKKYSDMFNANIWLDDQMVQDGEVHKYYSILPRVEIYIRYLNYMTNVYQYNQVINRKDYNTEYPINYLDNFGRPNER